MEDKTKGLEKEIKELKVQINKINEKLFTENPETDINGNRIRKDHSYIKAK